MSLDAWPLTLKTARKALAMRELNPEPSGTAEFHYVCDEKDYYLFCADFPDVYISRFVNLSEIKYDETALRSAINAINRNCGLVKVAYEDAEELIFQLGWREYRYLDFLRDIVSLTRKLEDAITSFSMACEISEEVDRYAMKEFVETFVNPENPLVKNCKHKS